jgi:hypothetical protein
MAEIEEIEGRLSAVRTTDPGATPEAVSGIEAAPAA